MSELSMKECEICRFGAPQVTEEESQKLMLEIPDWEVIKLDGINRLRRTFEFPNFIEAIAYTNKVGEISEKEGHHPAILTEWGKVTVTWWTHKIKGLHNNDFIMAAKTDQLI